jgi:hypothetical protein
MNFSSLGYQKKLIIPFDQYNNDLIKKTYNGIGISKENITKKLCKFLQLKFKNKNFHFNL